MPNNTKRFTRLGRLTTLLPIISILLLAGQGTIVHANANEASSSPICTRITSWYDFVTVVNDHQEKHIRRQQRRERKQEREEEELFLPSYKVLPEPILLCPFHITHNGGKNASGVDIVVNGTPIVCFKDGGGGEDGDFYNERCVISGNGRHLNLKADGIMLLGFDFYGSEYGAIVIDGNVDKEDESDEDGGSGEAISSRTTIIDCGFYDNDRGIGDNGNGGAIESVENRGSGLMGNNTDFSNGIFSSLFVMDSKFERNSAPSGGAIHATAQVVSILSSEFMGNSADGSDDDGVGGAANLCHGIIQGSTFEWNTATSAGPVIHATGNVCEAGMSYACTDDDYHSSICDGVFYHDVNDGEVCDKFSQTCEYPSSMPSSTPTTFPSGRPSLSQSPSSQPSAKPSPSPTTAPSSQPTSSPLSQPSSSPTLSPTDMPSLSPSSIPTSTPTSNPTSMPSAAPTAVPTTVPTGAPSAIPTIKHSSSPSAVPTLAPTAGPTASPSSAPSSSPTVSPTSGPTSSPSSAPSSSPTEYPTSSPNSSPSSNPTSAPTVVPTLSFRPTNEPSYSPSAEPTVSMMPTMTCNMTPAERGAMIKIIIAAADNVNKTTLFSDGTIENESMEWLIKLDDMYVCPQMTNLLQRYGAFIVHKKIFGTNPPSTHECSWSGFSCNEEMMINDVKFDDLSIEFSEEFSTFNAMESVVIQKGNMTGSIPQSLLDLPNIKQIDLDKNAMSGSINRVDNGSLLRLDINFNEFTGDIEFLTSFPNLMFAQLDNNQFTGTIPESLGFLTNLKTLTLHGNSLTGTMPESVCNLVYHHNLIYLMADCEGMEPKVKCPCCSHCNPYRQ